MKDHIIPKATAKRLPLYYRYLRILNNAGKKKVSSTELSEAVQVDSATIRRDKCCADRCRELGKCFTKIQIPSK